MVSNINQELHKQSYISSLTTHMGFSGRPSVRKCWLDTVSNKNFKLRLQFQVISGMHLCLRSWVKVQQHLSKGELSIVDEALIVNQRITLSNVEVTLDPRLCSIRKKLLNVLLGLRYLVRAFDIRFSRKPRGDDDHLGISVVSVKAR